MKARHEALRNQAEAAGVDLATDDEAETLFGNKRSAKQEKQAEDEKTCLEQLEANNSVGEELPGHEWEGLERSY